MMSTTCADTRQLSFVSAVVRGETAISPTDRMSENGICLIENTFRLYHRCLGCCTTPRGSSVQILGVL